MRKLLSLPALMLLIPSAVASPAGADGWTLTPGGWVSGGVEYVRTVPFEAGTGIDAVLHGKYLYTTTWRSFSIYDVSRPLSPELLSQTPAPAQLINEHPQTNGKILLLANDNIGRALDIYDVTDKTAPKKIATYADPINNHMWTCVLDCDYAYGARGTILDLSKPEAPVAVGDWQTLKPSGFAGFHAIEEVAPGLVLTGSVPVLYIDARVDAAKPKLLAQFTPPTTTPKRPYIIIRGAEKSVPARLDWPEDGKARYLVITMETPFSGSCDAQSGGFLTYDTFEWEKHGKFTLVDEYKMTSNGLPDEGEAPVNLFGCSAYGLDVNESFGTTGLVATTFFEHGTRVLRVGDDGKIAEAGGFVGAAGNAVRPLWRNDEVLYVMDAQRGMDVLYVHGDDQ